MTAIQILKALAGFLILCALCTFVLWSKRK